MKDGEINSFLSFFPPKFTLSLNFNREKYFQNMYSSLRQI